VLRGKVDWPTFSEKAKSLKCLGGLPESNRRPFPYTASLREYHTTRPKPLPETAGLQTILKINTYILSALGSFCQSLSSASLLRRCTRCHAHQVDCEGKMGAPLTKGLHCVFLGSLQWLLWHYAFHACPLTRGGQQAWTRPDLTIIEPNSARK
jgi:hypothetical protein